MVRFLLIILLAVASQLRADGLRCVSRDYFGTVLTDGINDSRALEVSGDFVFIANREGGLVIADVSDPDLPQVLSELPEVGFALDVARNSRYVYVGTAGNGLVVVDTDNGLSQPEVVYTYAGVTNVIDIAVDRRRERMYIA